MRAILVLLASLACAGERPGDLIPVDAVRAYDSGQLRKAVELLLPTANKGDGASAFMLGSIYEGGGDGVVKNPIEARKWYKVAFKGMKQKADAGDPQAMSNLAYMHMTGQGTALDYDEGFRLAKAAADRGFPGAFQNLADCYENGHGVRRDLVRAVAWYRLALANGVPAAEADAVKLDRKMTPDQRTRALKLAFSIAREHGWPTDGL